MSLILSGTDGLSDVDGSAATPAIRGTDANTGMFFPAADTIAFSEGGVESMRINASGNVQIGGTTDLGRLAVYNTTTDPSLSSNSGVGLCVRGSSTVRLNMGSYSTSPFVAWIQASDGAGSTFGLSLQPLGGNVGIGTSSPSSALTLGAGGAARFNRADNATYNEIKYVTSGDQFYFNQANNGNYTFNFAGTEKIRFTAAGDIVLAGGNTAANGVGITFPATQSASSDANTLDDYEEGTWTPIIGGIGGQSGQSYGGGQEGHYTKIGRVVTVSFRVVLSVKGTITGDVAIGGLPFTSQNSITYGSGVTIWATLATNWNYIYLSIVPNTTYARVDGTKSAVSTIISATTSDIGDTSQFNGSLTYIV